MLNFIGNGSAFNTQLGNNGAFIKKDGVLFLIDCGSSTFGRLQQSDLLNNVEHIVVLLTHTHPDHIGSLGDLIFYGYYGLGKMKEPSVYVYAPFKLNVSPLLGLMGVGRETYHLIQFTESAGFHCGDFHMNFNPVEVNHVEELNCYGYILKHGDITAYYSGDSNDIPKDILDSQNKGEFDYFYQDTCKADYEGNVHLSLRKLDELVVNGRDKVYCMHLDNGFNKAEAEEIGFNVVSQ